MTGTEASLFREAPPSAHRLLVAEGRIYEG